jgi:hypothetical protein
MILAFLPLFFVAIWFATTTLLALLSGWVRLMATYPDQPDEPLLQLRHQSGMMGLWVGMSGILTLSVCPRGLRVGMMRMLGPFCRNFFVPWGSVEVVRTTILTGPVAKLQFGNPVVGTLTVPSRVANRLARAAMGRWPEPGPFPEETRGQTFRRLLVQWAAITCLAALFFALVPLIVVPSGSRPPIWVGILFPAIVCGVAFVAEFVRTKG